MKRPLSYYAYISDAKVDALLAQLSASERQELASKIECDLGVLSAEPPATRSSANRVFRLKAVIDYIADSDSIGTLSTPARWVHDAGRFLWARLGSPLEAHVAVLGARDTTFVSLVGSARHLVGSFASGAAAVSISNDPETIAHAERLLGDMAGRITEFEVGHGRSQAAGSVLSAAAALDSAVHKATLQNLEFFAFVYEYGPHYRLTNEGPIKTGHQLVFGSPLYVAMT